MKVIIHFTWNKPDGYYHDSLCLTGSIKEIRQKAWEEAERRKPDDFYSEVIEEDD